jgi:hypothetical protein
MLDPPESIIPIKYTIDVQCNKRQADYSSYVVTAFNNTDIDKRVDYIDNLQQWSARYTLWNSSLVDYDGIVRDIHAFFASGINIPDARIIQAIIQADRVDTRVIHMLLYMEQAKHII